MEFEQVLALRRSTRRFTNQAVPEEDIEKMLAAAQRVPVGHADYKGYAVAAITDPKILKLLAEENEERSGRGDPIYGAPLLFLIMRTPHAREDSVKLNAGIIAENIHLAATNLGYGSLCVYSFIRTLSKAENFGRYFKAFHMPDGYEPAMSVAVGCTDVPFRERKLVKRMETFRIREG